MKRQRRSSRLVVLQPSLFVQAAMGSSVELNRTYLASVNTGDGRHDLDWGKLGDDETTGCGVAIRMERASKLVEK